MPREPHTPATQPNLERLPFEKIPIETLPQTKKAPLSGAFSRVGYARAVPAYAKNSFESVIGSTYSPSL